MAVTRVVVVDDAESTLDVMATFFIFEGYEVRTARDGQEGVDITREFEPDLILMDLLMPIKDGYQATHEIRKIPGIKQPLIVALSGWTIESVQEKIDGAGFDRVLSKPVSPDDLRALLV